jgi:hypothetical protein
MTERVTQLQAALSAQKALLGEAQAEIARSLSKERESPGDRLAQRSLSLREPKGATEV